MSQRKTNPTVFVVTAEIPDGATVTDAKQYIRDALGSWGGSFHPDDALFSGLICTVRKQGDRMSLLTSALGVALQEQTDRLAQIRRYDDLVNKGEGDRDALMRAISNNKFEADCAGRIVAGIRKLIETC